MRYFAVEMSKKQLYGLIANLIITIALITFYVAYIVTRDAARIEILLLFPIIFAFLLILVFASNINQNVKAIKVNMDNSKEVTFKTKKVKEYLYLEKVETIVEEKDEDLEET